MYGQTYNSEHLRFHGVQSIYPHAIDHCHTAQRKLLCNPLLQLIA